jgi:hypothetical protein
VLVRRLPCRGRAASACTAARRADAISRPCMRVDSVRSRQLAAARGGRPGAQQAGAPGGSGGEGGGGDEGGGGLARGGLGGGGGSGGGGDGLRERSARRHA